MRRLLVLIALLLSIAGCAWLGKQADYAQQCANDPNCLSEQKAKSHLVTVLVSEAFPPAASAAGAVSLALFLWWGGKQKEKKK